MTLDTPFTSARGWWYRSKNAMLVRVTTDAGIEGWGEAYGPPEVARTVVDTLLAPQVTGRDPLEVELMVDANHGYRLADALALGREFQRMGLTWLEEPVSPDDLDAYRELREKLDIPLAGGENQFTRHAFAAIVNRRAMDIVQPDVCCAGGLTETRKIATLADGLRNAIRIAKPPVGLLAASTGSEEPAWHDEFAGTVDGPPTTAASAR